MLHGKAVVALLVEPQHAQDLLSRRPPARRLADPPIAQAPPAPHRATGRATAETSAPRSPASPPLPPAIAHPAHAARATPRNASVVPLAAPPPGPSPAPFSSGSKPDRSCYKNRTDH